MTCMWSSQKCGTRSIYGETVSWHQPPRVPLSRLLPSNQINGRIPRSSVLEKPRYSWDGPNRGPPPSIGVIDRMDLVVLAAFFSIELDHLTFDVKGWDHQICVFFFFVFFQVCLISSTVWPSNLQFHTFVTQSFCFYDAASLGFCLDKKRDSMMLILSFHYKDLKRIQHIFHNFPCNGEFSPHNPKRVVGGTKKE